MSCPQQQTHGLSLVLPDGPEEIWRVCSTMAATSWQVRECGCVSSHAKMKTVPLLFLFPFYCPQRRAVMVTGGSMWVLVHSDLPMALLEGSREGETPLMGVLSLSLDVPLRLSSSQMSAGAASGLKPPLEPSSPGDRPPPPPGRDSRSLVRSAPGPSPVSGSC